jgi:hypothetical protein
MPTSATLVQPDCWICRNATAAKTNVAYSTLAAGFTRFLTAVHKNFAERLEQRGRAKMSIIAAAMRKLLVLAYGVLKSGQPFDPAYNAF